jgi:hypothetical protein
VIARLLSGILQRFRTLLNLMLAAVHLGMGRQQFVNACAELGVRAASVFQVPATLAVRSDFERLAENGNGVGRVRHDGARGRSSINSALCQKNQKPSPSALSRMWPRRTQGIRWATQCYSETESS